MAQGFSKETVGVLDGTLTVAAKMNGIFEQAKVRTFVATFDLSLATVAKNSGDTNVCFRIPRSHKPLFGFLDASVTMGASATIAVGNATTAGKYRAAAVQTGTDTPAFFMLSTALQADPLATHEDVIITIGTAALPGAGILQVVMFASAR